MLNHAILSGAHRIRPADFAQEVIENEFLAAISSLEKPATVSPATTSSPASALPSPLTTGVVSTTSATTLTTTSDPNAFTSVILAQLYDEQQQREQLLRQRRRLPSAPAFETRPAPSAENDYEDVEQGQTEWRSTPTQTTVRPSRPPRRKRSRSTGDYESLSIDGGADETGVALVMPDDASKAPPEMVPTTSAAAAAAAAESLQLTRNVGEQPPPVNDRIEAIQLCPLLDVSEGRVLLVQLSGLCD